MGFSGGVKVGVGSRDTDITSHEEEQQEGIKEGKSSTTSSTTGNTQNSGRVDVGQTMTNSGTSGSVNSIVTGPSSSTTRNSGRVDTSQVMIDKEGLDYIAQGMLESKNGLAAISSGKNISGGYNSTVGSMLTNDLLARISGEVAVRGAKTVNTIGASSSTTDNTGNTVTQNIGGNTSFSTSDSINNIGASSSQTNSSTESNTVSEDKMASVLLRDKQESKQEDEKTKEANSKWILCTELVRQGRMNKKFYNTGLRVFMSYDAETKTGYYLWAVPMLAHLKAKPFSMLSRAVKVMLCARAEQLAAEASVTGARRTFLGYFSKQLVHVCWLLGVVILLPSKVSKYFSPSEV